MVELVDSVDLGAVTLVKVFLPPPAQKNENAGMLESVDWTDFGAVTSVKVFSTMR